MLMSLPLLRMLDVSFIMLTNHDKIVAVYFLLVVEFKSKVSPIFRCVYGHTVSMLMSLPLLWMVALLVVDLGPTEHH